MNENQIEQFIDELNVEPELQVSDWRPLLDECLLIITNLVKDAPQPKMSKSLKNEYDAFLYINDLQIRNVRKSAISKLTEEERKILNL